MFFKILSFSELPWNAKESAVKFNRQLGPVFGSQGRLPDLWHRAAEIYGFQLQNDQIMPNSYLKSI